MNRTPAVAAVVAVVAGVLVLAACTGDDTGADGSSAGETSTGGVVGEAFDPDREPPAPPIDGAVVGGTVTVLSENGLGAKSGLDPTSAYLVGFDGSLLSGLVTRSLTQHVYDPAQGAVVVVPDIATDIGTPNEDFTEWTFTIRDGVRFEDGTEVSADDVAFGIKRSFAASFDGASYSNDYFVDGDTYRGPYESGTNYPGVVVDGDTLTLTMDRPFPDMPYWAAFPAMGPIPEGSDPATYGRHPLATGPYKLSASYTGGTSLTLVRNDEWDPATDPGRHAYPDRYVFRFNHPLEQTVATILGDSDRAQTMVAAESVPTGDYRQAQRLDRLTVGPGLITNFWVPDYDDVDEIEVRQAIGYAFPYQAVARTFGESFGVTFVFGESILPPGFPGRRDYSVLDTEAGQTDPDKAKALLKQAGYAPGEYELAWPTVTGDPFQKKVAKLMIEAFEAAGFKASPFPTDDWGEWFEVIMDSDAPVNLRYQGFSSDYPSGGSWLPALFGSDSNDLVSGFSEPAVDAEIDRIAALPIDEQPAAWADLDETIMTDYYPQVATGYDVIALLHGSRIGGMNIDNATGFPTYKDLYVIP